MALDSTNQKKTGTNSTIYRNLQKTCQIHEPSAGKLMKIVDQRAYYSCLILILFAAYVRCLFM